MGRTPRIPSTLKRRPFSLNEARRFGLTRKSLCGKAWRRLAAELYCWSGWREDPWQLVSAWRSLLPPDATFAGATAAWLWGIGDRPANPIEVIVSPTAGLRSRPGLEVRRAAIDANDVTDVRGLRATSVHRTLRDLCARLPVVEALIAVDRAVRASHTNGASLSKYAASAKGRPGAARLLSLAVVAAPAESPMESRLRWLLLQAGLPKPAVQLDMRDSEGRFVGRADLCYPRKRLVIEYDGANHRDRLAEDNRRQNLLISAGYTLLRFTASDLERPDIVTSQVRRALRGGDV